MEGLEHQVRGLSPRVRGNLLSTRREGAPRGSIPACAGEPVEYEKRGRAPWVYPRVCGGTREPFNELLGYGGLSPRVRGNRAGDISPAAAAGSIPACAGEPVLNMARTERVAVYPRVCGGTGDCDRKRVAGIGLSPRVRGNLGAMLVVVAYWRSIPACAGEPASQHRSARRYRVYPRVCGGTISAAYCSGWDKGLSPRVRGNLAGRTARRRPWRSIPACAGEPLRRSHAVT